MNINRDAPYRLVTAARLWWSVNGRWTLIELRFSPGIMTGERSE